MPVARAQEGPARPASSATPSPDPKKARRAFQQAEQSETVRDWPQAFKLYEEAALYAPQNRDYLLRREAARFQVIQAHMDRGERAAIAGRFDEARKELEAATALDPTYTVAQERLEQLRRPKRTLQSFGQQEAGLAALDLQPGKRSFDYRGETRGAFEEVAKQFGVTASFDPDLRPKQIRFRVDDLDFETAMRVLCQVTDTFWFPLDVHSFHVAEDTAQKRREIEPSVVRTVAISSLATPEQFTELTRLARDITGITRTQLDTRTRTLTLRGSPAAVALAVRLITELDQALGEMMLEIDILEVDRNSMLRMGITPPSTARAFTISPADIDEAQQSPEALLRVLQRIFGTGTASSLTGGGGALIPPLVAFGGGRTIGLATLPGATADFLEAYSILRRGRRLLLRAQDGQRATFFIGERFPVALATLQPNLISPLAVNVGGNTFPRTDLEAADGPVAIVTADFDQDGQSDLAVANANANSISIFLGLGTGSFEARTDIALPATEMKPSAIAVADFNADGRPDIVVTNEDSNSIAILLQDPGGTFTITTRTVGTAPGSVVAASLNPNTDSNLDLAIANFDDNSITILLGNGDGTFQPDILLQNFGQGPRALAVGTLNNDNLPDLVVVNETSETVAVLTGNGDGTFTFFAEGNTGDAPSAVLLADFDADNVLDLVVANRDSDTISLLLGNGDGTFAGATEFVTGDAPAGLATGDFNIDGVPDLAVVNEEGDSVSILLGSGGGTFGLRADFATGDAPTSVVAVDFDTDGRRDLAITNRDGDSVSIILNQISLLPPGFTAGQPYPAFQYEDLGVKVRATPRLHPNQEVTLQLEMEIRSRSGQTINGIPVISNRTLEQTVRLRENQRTVLTGIIQREERLGIAGWPGLASVPGVGHAAGRRDRERPETELLIVITPRRIRLADRAGKMLYVGRETGTTGGTAPPQQ